MNNCRRICRTNVKRIRAFCLSGSRCANWAWAVVLYALWTWHLSASAQTSNAQTPYTARVTHNNRSITGWPLATDQRQLAVLQMDGQLKLIQSTNAKTERIADSFQPFTSDQIAANLQREFGRRYQITQTKHFVVAHPPGSRKIWADSFETLFEKFRLRFESTAITPKPPPFPLVAVVARSRKEFERYLNNELGLRSRAVEGYYSQLSNRIMTYDPGAKIRVGDDSFILTDATVKHEVAHQLAFNLGIHNRYAPPPKWLSEGLAMMLETERSKRNGVTRLPQNNGLRRRSLNKFFITGKPMAC